MSTINVYVVKNALEAEGWQLVSEVYKNLKTPIEMICPQGHKQEQTFDNWRKHKICDICMAGDPYKVKKNKVPKKGTDTQRILCLDAATSITGYSIYDNKVLVGYGTFRTNSSYEAIERINQVKNWLKAALKEWQPDFVGIENIQLQKYGAKATDVQVKTFQTLANLQGVLMDTIFEACIDSDLVRPSEWRSYCGINDGDVHRDAKKKQAQAKVKIWYDIDCTEDEADAICIGKYFCGKLKTHNNNWGEEI